MTRYDRLIICIELAQACAYMGDTDAKYRLAAYKAQLTWMGRT